MSVVRCKQCGEGNDTTELVRCANCNAVLPLPDASYGLADKKDEGVKETPHVQFAKRSARKRKKRPASGARWTEGAGLLFVLAGIQFLAGMVLLSMSADFVPGYDPTVAAVIVILLGLVFAGLGVVALFRPVLALVIGVLLYFFVTAADFVALARAKASPRVAPIVVRAFFIIALAGAATRAREQSRSPFSPDT